TAVDTAGNVAFKASIQRDAAYNAGGYTCGTAATPVASIRFLSDNWNTAGPTPVATVDVVAYYSKAAGPVSELHRIKCPAGATTPASDLTLARYVDPGTVSVSCTVTTDCRNA